MLQEPATQILSDPDMERLLLLTGGVLTGASAMELRAVLLAAAQLNTWRNAQLTLQEVAQSTAALRTMGHMLLPRLEEASVEESMAAAMVEQGGSVAQLTQELEEALHPLSGSSTVRMHRKPEFICCACLRLARNWLDQQCTCMYHVHISRMHKKAR